MKVAAHKNTPLLN